MVNKTQQGDTKVVLDALHFDAIALRYQGLTYKEIHKKLWDKHGKFVLEQRLRRWFAKGGVLHQPYREYAQAETEERKELMHQQLRKLGMSIPDILQDTLFQPMRNPFTGQLIKDENNNVVYVRNKTTNEAVKILAQLLGAKFADDDTEKVKDKLEEYFERLENAPLPGDAKAIEAPKETTTPATS